MDINDEILIESPSIDPSTDEQGQSEQPETVRKSKRAESREVGKLKAQLKLLHDSHEQLKAEMDSYRVQSQGHIDQIRDDLAIRNQQLAETDASLIRSRVRCDEFHEQLKAEKETNAMLRNTIRNFERDAKGMMPKRFDESSLHPEVGEEEESQTHVSLSRKRPLDDENQDDDDTSIRGSETGLSSEGRWNSNQLGQGIRLSLTPRDFHQPILKSTDYGAITQYNEEIFQCNSFGMADTRPLDRTKELKSKALATTIDDQFKAPANAAKIGEEVAKHWKDREKVSDERFVVALKQVFGSGTDRGSSNSFEALRVAVNDVRFDWDPTNQSSLTPHLIKIREIEEDALGGVGISPENHRALVLEFITTLKARNSQERKPHLFETARRLRIAYDAKQINTLGQLARWLSDDGAEANKTAAKAAELGLFPANTGKVGGGSGNNYIPDNSHANSGKPKNLHNHKPGDKRKTEPDKANKGAKPKVGDICTGCGRDNHITSECKLKHHPDWNTESKPWVQSTSGKAYAALPESVSVLPYRSVLKPLSSEGAAYLQAQQASQNAPKGKGKEKKGTEYIQAHLLFLTHHNAERIYAVSTRHMLDDNSLLPVKIIHANHRHTRHRALIDTGALHGNYVSREMAQTLREQGAIGIACRQRIISVLKRHCRNSEQLC